MPQKIAMVRGLAAVNKPNKHSSFGRHLGMSAPHDESSTAGPIWKVIRTRYNYNVQRD